MTLPILFTIPNFITAGSGRAMLNIVERLDRSRFSPAVCVDTKGGDLDAVVEEMGIPFLEAPFTIPIKPYRTLLQRARRASRPFQAYNFRLWHSFHYLDDYSEPLIARMSGAEGWIYTKKNMNWHQRAWHMRSLLAKGIAVQNSDMLNDFFQSPLYRRKTQLTPRGVVTSKFTSDIDMTLQLRAKHSVPVDAILVGCVANLLPVKGHPTLIKAVANLPKVHLLLAGKPLDDEYVANLHALVNELNLAERVHFLGNVGNVPALLAELDVFVLPTWAKWRQEGCPVALLEAMASGTACIASDIPGSRDIIENGQSGLLVPPEDVERLAARLRQLVADDGLRALLAAAARQRVLDNYKIEHEVARHESLYLKVTA